MEECAVRAYMTHSILAGVVSPFVAWFVRRLLGRHWSLNPDAFDDANVGLIEGALVTFIVCFGRRIFA